MRQLNDGSLEQAPSEYLQKTREEVTSAIEELLDVGARIRPLLVRNKRVGWARGVHPSERKALKRWIYDDIELIEQLLLLGTTLSGEEIRSLSTVEMRSLSRVIREMTDSDLRLYPFISAFVTTNVSEQLWFSKGTEITAFRERTARMPDGKQVRISAASDQARSWATLCNYRMQAKQRLDASMNAVLMIRPWVGKGADPITADLKSIARSLQTDTLEPWRETIQIKRISNLDDGWAHSEDDSIEGMQRELMGMVNNDRHEQLIARFEEQERARAEKRQQAIDEQIARRGGRGFIEQSTSVMTEAEVQERVQALKAGRPQLALIVEEDSRSSPQDRLAKYR
jgi:hypothetical protein